MITPVGQELSLILRVVESEKTMNLLAGLSRVKKARVHGCLSVGVDWGESNGGRAVYIRELPGGCCLLRRFWDRTGDVNLGTFTFSDGFIGTRVILYHHAGFLACV